MTPTRGALNLTAESATDFKNLYLDTDLGPLDCLSYVNGIGDYEQVRQVSRPIDINGLRVYVLGIDALIVAKQAMNRPRDIEAVRQLKALKALGKPPSAGGKAM